MAATQLGFSLRTSANCKTVHLLGSWDNYSGQLPLSRDASKPGSWKSTFRFQGSTLQPGKRYWYYYIMDGYHVSHDPAKPFTKEPTTGRSLNILDVPKSAGTAGPAKANRHLAEIPTGRGLSPSRIVAPKPSKPYASRRVREADYSQAPVDELTAQFERAELYDGARVSPALSSAAGSDISSRASSGSPSSLSSLSDRSNSSCRCDRWGITRKGDKVRLDCGGSRCGYPSDDSSSCCSSSEDEAPRRQVRARPPVNVRRR